MSDGHVCNLCNGNGKIVPPKPEVTTHGKTKVYSMRADSFIPKMLLNQVLGERELNPGDVFYMNNYDRDPDNPDRRITHVLLCINVKTHETTEKDKRRSK